MTLFTNPTFRDSIIILLLCFVLLRFIQVYSVFSGDCIHSITRVKMIESLLCPEPLCPLLRMHLTDIEWSV